jgi:hypothetical protein
LALSSPATIPESTRSTGEYKIHASQGQGDIVVKTKKTLKKAIKWIKKHDGEASFGIELPNGTWHKW